MSGLLTRRKMLGHAAAGGGAAMLVGTATAAHGKGPSTSPEAFRYCLNTSTIREKKLPLDEIVDLAAKAGYQGIEPWIREIETFTKAGGSLRELKQRIADRGLTVESAIGFAPWLVDDDDRRAAGMEQAKRDMDLVLQIGGHRIAAPPAGAYGQENLNLAVAAERYRALLEAGSSIGVTPQLEFWGSAKSLYRLSQAAFIAVESGHPDACLLPDVYHLFRGGSRFAGLGLLDGGAIHCFHVNDYPGDIPRTEQNDSHRVYPGDGVAPWKLIVQTLAANGFRGALSLELFNRDYWKQDPLEVARTGLEKTRAVVAEALG